MQPQLSSKMLQIGKDSWSRIDDDEPGQSALYGLSYHTTGCLPRDNKGHSGLVISIGGVPTFHRSTKQKLVSMFAMQAEIVALFESFPSISWLRDLFGRTWIHSARPIEQDSQRSLSILNRAAWYKENQTLQEQDCFHQGASGERSHSPPVYPYGGDIGGSPDQTFQRCKDGWVFGWVVWEGNVSGRAESPCEDLWRGVDSWMRWIRWISASL
jgi:hypothetical protein